MQTSLQTKITRWFLSFCQLQFFLWLVTLPLMLWWGLPFSVVAPLSNLIFAPILMAFLLISSLIFFCELFGIPNELLIWILEQLTAAWSWIMQFGTPHWLIHLALPSAIWLLVIPVLPLIIMQHSKAQRLVPSVVLMGILCCGIGGWIKYAMVPKHSWYSVMCNEKELHLMRVNNQTILVDAGSLARKPSVTATIDYRLLPELTKKWGTTTIDHCIILRPTNRLFEALAHLCTKVNVNNLYLPVWDGNLSRQGRACYRECMKACSDNNVTLNRLKATYRIALGKNNQLVITPQAKKLVSTNLSFPVYELSGSIYDQAVKIKSS